MHLYKNALLEHLSTLYNTPHSPILFILHLSDLHPTSTHIHTLMKVFENNSGFRILPKDALACALEQPGIKSPIVINLCITH